MIQVILVVLAIAIVMFVLAFVISFWPFILALIGITWCIKTYVRSRASRKREKKPKHKQGAGVSPEEGKWQTEGQYQSQNQRTESRSTKGQGEKQYRQKQHHSRREERNSEHFRHQESRSFQGNYYERLGIEPSASREEIEAAWRRIDYGQNLSIEIRRACFEAFRVLSDPELRRSYDRDLFDERRERERQNSAKRGSSQGSEGKRRRYQERTESKESSENRQEEHQQAKLLSENYYERLDVRQSATPAEIKSAWLRINKQWHPDRCRHPDATRVTQACNEAYSVLSDPRKRGNYDSLLGREQTASPYATQAGPQSNSPSTRRGRRDRGTQKAEYRNERQTYRRSTQFYTGTWAKIRRGPWTGTWGAWIESLYVGKGDIALIKRRDGRQCLVLIIQVLSRSQGNRVTLCRVHNIGTP